MFAASKSGSPAEATDAQFNYVTMLLHGDGTNGAQNNTFVDSSTNAFSITRNGNPTQGTFTPYGVNWSNYFGIATSDLKFASNAAFGVGTGNFSIEFFVNISEWAGHQRFFMTGDSGLDAIQLGRPFADSIGLDMNNGRIITYSWVPNIGQWYHIALVRSGTGTNQIALYIDGVSVATGTSSYSVPAKDAFVGGNDWNTDRSCRGYISNMRFSNTARTITVPTSAYTSDANTLILTCQSNRFIDNSSNGFPAIAQGSPSVQRFSPFSPTSAYSTSVIGGSGYFDGSDSLSISSANTVLPTGTQDFSVELSVYWQTQSGSYPQIISNPTTSGFQIYYDVSAGALAVGIFNVANVITYTIAQSDLAGVWTHIAVTRSSTTFRLFVNGVLRANGTNVISFASPTTQYIASDGSRPYTGYITDVRTCLGSIPTSYQTTSTTNGTSIFTSPTAPVTTSSQGAANTALLLSYTNAGILDNAMMNDLETVGNAQISTSVKKYGTGSIAFDGSGDRLVAQGNPSFNFGSGSFTVELWLYLNSVSANQWIVGPDNTVTYPWVLQTIGSEIRFLSNNAANDFRPTSFTLTTGTWNHFAVTRSGSTMYWFTNGTLNGTQTYSNAIGSDTINLQIGTTGSGSGDPLNGYIDDLRITKGVARYTSSFTAPIAAFADKGPVT